MKSYCSPSLSPVESFSSATDPSSTNNGERDKCEKPENYINLLSLQMERKV